MSRFIAMVFVTALPLGAWAEDTSLFGPEGEPMTELLLRQALDIAEMEEQEFRGRTKSVREGSEGYDEFDLLRDMYQRDPEATLTFLGIVRAATEGE